MNDRIKKILLFYIVIFGTVSLIIENLIYQDRIVDIAGHVLDFAMFFLFIIVFAVDLMAAGDKKRFLIREPVETLLAALLVFAFFSGKIYHFFLGEYQAHDIPVKLVLALTVFSMIRFFFERQKIRFILEKLSLHPAQTIMLSFLAIITAGTVLLMLPVSTSDHTRLGFVDSLFTAVSATCVTGLIVVDTATRFSYFGKAVIMALIQCGGLGIMIFAYFAGFLVGKKLTFEQKMTISYLLEENDTRKLRQAVRNIVFITFAVELVGALLLFAVFRRTPGGFLRAFFFSVFHSVSAFCNAGFALFSDNLEAFRSNALLNFTVAGLIILGGLSFPVISNYFKYTKSKIRKRLRGRPAGKEEKLTLNTQIVIIFTAVLVLSGMFMIYKLEHRLLLERNIWTQYLMAFFQSVTLRTAGFNTMKMTSLHSATYAIMMLFMFIGGASGSTAGGIKVNTAGVIWAYVRSVFKNRSEVVFLKHSISGSLINQAFLVILLSLGVVFSGALALCITEDQKFVKILFEVFSAFGTVGLSAGITPQLSNTGKMVISLLVFIGRLGPLTIVTALSLQYVPKGINYPDAKVYIG